MSDPFQNARAYYDVTYPSSGDSFSIANMKNALQGHGFLDFIPLQPRAHSPADTKIMVRGRDASSFYNPIYSGNNDARVFFGSGDSPAMAAPVSNPRIDIVYMTPSGDLRIQTGAEAASPTLPSLSPSGDSRMPICAIFHKTTMLKVVNFEDRNSNTGDSYIYQDLRPWLRFPTAPSSSSSSSSSSSGSVKNAIINGNFNIWQRGTTFTSQATAKYSADRWALYYISSTGVFDVTRDTSVPTVGQSNTFSNYSLKLNVTTADTSVAATEFLGISQRIEGYNFTAIAQRAFTLSFWVKSNKTGTYCVAFRNTGLDACYTAEYTINAANTWEKKTINVTASPSTGTWNYVNGMGLDVFFTLACGSNFQGTAGTWNASTTYGTSNQVNLMDTINNNFQIAQVQVEVGSTANALEQRIFQQELAMCQRYYWKSFAQGTTPAQATGSDSTVNYICSLGGTTQEGQSVRFPTPMRATPTITFFNPVNANTKWHNRTLAADSGASGTAPNVSLGESSFLSVNAQVIGDTAGNEICIHATAEVEL